MTADQGMQHARRGLQVVGGRHPCANESAAVVGAIVLDAQPCRPALQRVWQALIGRAHVAKPGAAPGRRDFQRIERARLGGFGR